MTLEEVTDAALALSPDERADLLDRLHASLADETPSDEQLARIRRRAREVQSGTARVIPHDEVMSLARQITRQ